MKYELYDFSLDDAPYEILEEIHTASFFDSWDGATFEALLTTFGTKGVYIKVAKKSVGFILYRQAFDDAEIITICVLPEYQNKDYGNLLLKEMLKKLNKPGKCFLEVSEFNKDAIQLYKKNGFKISHVRKNYYGENKDAYMMMLEVLN